jgi:hypothetical protein
VLQRFREQHEAEQESRISATRLQLAAIRQLQRYLEAGRQTVARGSPVISGRSVGRDADSGGD